MGVAAAMDLGSNTLRLLTARVEEGRFRTLDRGLCTLRLVQGLKPGDPLPEDAKARVLAQAGAFAQSAKDMGAKNIVLAATQACRLASDGAGFVGELGATLGLDRAVVLTGPEEARLTRLGVLSRLKGPVKGAFLVDVGGGSTELAGLEDGVAPGVSVPLGAVSLTERYIKHDPPDPEELLSLRKAIRRGLKPLLQSGVKRLIATAGTACTLASLDLALAEYNPGLIDNHRLTKKSIEARIAGMAGMPLSQRNGLPGMEPDRADIMIAGAATLAVLLDLLHLNELTVMDTGLLEGILLDAMGWSEDRLHKK